MIRQTSRKYASAWEQRKLGELTESYSGGTPAAGESEFYGGSIPFIRSAEIAAESTELFLTEKGYESSSARMVKPGDVLYALYGATSGEVAVSRQKGAINQAILAILPRDDCDARYITAWLRKQKGYIVTTYLQGGQGNLSGVIVKNLEVSIPSLPEQQKIGFMLSHLDSLITLHQRKYDKLVIFKKSMLEKMFPKDGESVPEIRFAGFTDPWEQRKLGELSSEFQSGDFISAEEILGSGPYPVYGGNGLRGYAKQYNHDGFYALIGRQGALCGNVNTAVGKAYFTEHAVAVKANFLHDTRFLAHLLGCMDLGRYSGQSAQPGLAVGVLKEVETTVPSKAEQQAIGSFFSRLDSLITLHQRKLELLQNIKKSLLDKMFV